MSEDNENKEQPKYTLFQEEEDGELIENIKEKAEELRIQKSQCLGW